MEATPHQDLAKKAQELIHLLLQYGKEPHAYDPSTDAPWGAVVHSNLLSDLRTVGAWAEAQEGEED